jgi:aryl-alcohol dehydrogenase-like predicted oxidoreductase
LKSKGCEIHTRSAFLQGIFFSDTKNLNAFFDDIKPVIQQLQKFGNALPGMLLNHCADKPFIDKVIFGVNTLSQLKNNISNLSVTSLLPLKIKTIDDSILIPSKWPK